MWTDFGAEMSTLIITAMSGSSLQQVGSQLQQPNWQAKSPRVIVFSAALYLLPVLSISAIVRRNVPVCLLRKIDIYVSPFSIKYWPIIVYRIFQSWPYRK